MRGVTAHVRKSLSRLLRFLNEIKIQRCDSLYAQMEKELGDGKVLSQA